MQIYATSTQFVSFSFRTRWNVVKPFLWESVWSHGSIIWLSLAAETALSAFFLLSFSAAQYEPFNQEIKADRRAELKDVEYRVQSTSLRYQSTREWTIHGEFLAEVNQAMFDRFSALCLTNQRQEHIRRKAHKSSKQHSNYLDNKLKRTLSIL